MFRGWTRWWGRPGLRDEAFRKQRASLLARAPVPVFWMLGKAGSGKTSMIRYLTGAERAEIGSGFRPQTRRSESFDFPSVDEPLLRFLDTRGLGESRYDPAEDIDRFHGRTHVLIVTVRALDHAQTDILEPLRKIRQVKPRRPVLLALTCLHQAYPGQQHPRPDPFQGDDLPAELPRDLHRSLAVQLKRFEGLYDRWVAIDLTQPEDGFDEMEFGGQRLRAALLAMLPTIYRHTLLTLEESLTSLRSLAEKRDFPYILSASILAATAAAVPVPWVEIPFVLAVQSRLVYKLARLYGQPLNASTFFTLAGAIGGRLLARQAVRSALKFIPFAGSAANAALAYGYTYGLGRACGWFFREMRQGHVPTASELEQIWRDELQRAARAWTTGHRAAPEPGLPEPGTHDAQPDRAEVEISHRSGPASREPSDRRRPSTESSGISPESPGKRAAGGGKQEETP